MPYSDAASSEASPSSVCARSSCDDPAVVAVAHVELILGGVLTSRLCASCARLAVDDLLRRAVLRQATPSLALSPIDQEA